MNQVLFWREKRGSRVILVRDFKCRGGENEKTGRGKVGKFILFQSPNGTNILWTLRQSKRKLREIYLFCFFAGNLQLYLAFILVLN